MSLKKRIPFSSVAILALLTYISPTWGAPVLYSTPAYESPVRGDPDDLLLISGSGLDASDKVVYREAVNNQPGSAPGAVPQSSSFLQGVADLVSAADAPYSLTVHLPSAMAVGRTYALWVVSATGEWSNPVLINDARPLWITPDSSYQTANLAGLPRVLKVVGRNLQPNSGTDVTQVRLIGVNTGTVYTLTANSTQNDPNTTAALERYVAKVNLPSSMAVDQYTVQVSRDSVSWVRLLGNGQSPAQTFSVLADPTPSSAAQTFYVANFSDPLTKLPCQADGKTDATGCILLAIRAAELAGGGTVVFGPGTWLMSQIGSYVSGRAYTDRSGATGSCPPAFAVQTCGVTYYGVVVPVGVALQGGGPTGSGATLIERGTGWPITMPLFTFQGNNTVSGFYFKDDNNYLADYPAQNSGSAQLQLGLVWYFAHLWSQTDPLETSNVVITNNVFDKPWTAIDNAGLPADHVYITYNTFGGAFVTAIYVEENENSVANLGPNALYPYQGYRWDDIIVSHNSFYPSSFQQSASTYNGGGSIATQFNTGRRADYSDNVADGTSTQYLYNPGTDPKGWRAAFFWSTGASQEMTLVSNNTVSCSGDKYGDGEAIVYDGSGTLGGMPVAQPILTAAPWTDPQGVAGTTLTVQGTIITQLQIAGGPIDISSNPTPYYQGGFWLQVVQGMGKGEWRRVESVSLGANGAGSTVTLNVTPAMDVLPDASSAVLLGRAYWQNVTVNNYVDQRTPLCTKANARDSGGAISWYASTADSAMEGNQQYSTSGILLNHTYQPPQPGSTPVTAAGVALQFYNEVRNNLVSGAYDSSSNGRAGGIQLGFGATGFYCNGDTCPAAQPVNTGFGVTVAGNTVIQASTRDADGSPIGAIGFNPNWETGPFDVLGLSMWRLDDGSLVFHNTLQDISNTVAGSASGLPLVGIGIDVAQGTTPTPAVTWRSTLYANSCSNVDVPVKLLGLGTVRYCPAGGASSCECSGVAAVDVGVTATGTPGVVSAGGTATYIVTVTNSDPALTATDVNLSLEPSAGVQLTGTSFTASQGSCDSSVNTCLLGSLAAGQSATVTVSAGLPARGLWPTTFSVTHREPDSNTANNGVTVTESVQ